MLLEKLPEHSRLIVATFLNERAVEALTGDAPEPEPPADNVVDLRRWAERRGRWSAVAPSVGRRAA